MSKAPVAVPWFAPPRPIKGRRIAIIGAGIAGCAVARALHRLGWSPSLIDSSGVGTGASGNPSALLMPRLAADGGLHSRFYGTAFLHAVQALDDLQASGVPAWRSRGVLSVARDAAEAAHMVRLSAAFPAGQATVIGPEEAEKAAGVPTPHGGLWFPHGGAIDPCIVCKSLVQELPVLQAEVGALQKSAVGWTLLSPSGGTVAEADGVVLAAGPDVPRLFPAADLPVRAKRGQITLISAPYRPQTALSFGGYLTPHDQGLVLGATYDRWTDLDDTSWRRVREGDHLRNLAVLAEHLPVLADQPVTVFGGRSSLRATIADHMPVAGPLFDAAKFRSAYRDLHHGRRPDIYPEAPWEDGLYVLGALGSRGFQTAFLLADALAATMAGETSPLPKDMLDAIHPARFLVRSLKKAPWATKRLPR